MILLKFDDILNLYLEPVKNSSNFFVVLRFGLEFFKINLINKALD